MKNKLYLFALLTVILSLFSGCALHSGYMQSSASLNSNNFSYVKRDVQGSASALYVLGIGGLNKTALVNEAKNDLLKNYQLQNNQALVDITVNWKNTYYLLVMKNECTITASIVEFNK